MMKFNFSLGKAALAISVLLILIYTISVMVAAVEVGQQIEQEKLLEPVEVIEPEPISFDFNGMKCSLLEQEPTFTYRTSEQTVTFIVECHPDLMLQFFEAVDPEQ